MEEKQSLSNMPEVILHHIAKFLHYQDVNHLSMTCHHMKSILPSFMQIKGHNLDMTGPSVGDWIPECYFDTPRLTSTVQKITISMNWKDQVRSFHCALHLRTCFICYINYLYRSHFLLYRYI